LRRLGRFDEALAVIDEAIAVVPDRPGLHSVRRRILERR
jgi:hypothetical protein